MIETVKVTPKLLGAWDFGWPTDMTEEQYKKELQYLEGFIKEIEENPSEYVINAVRLAVVPKTPADDRSEVCILPYNAFKGYVMDAYIKLKEYYGRKETEK